jgi:hypothetical protein
MLGQLQSDVWHMEGEASEAQISIQTAILNPLQTESLENVGQNQNLKHKVQSWKNEGGLVQMKNGAQVMRRKKNEALVQVPKMIETEVEAKVNA